LPGSIFDDTFAPGLGNDRIDGGDGIDTANLPVLLNNYQFSQTGPNQVTLQYLGYTTVLDNVEFIEFGTSFKTRLPIESLLSGTLKTQLDQLTDLYLAFFGRAPDVPGIEYWQEQNLEIQRDFSTIAKDFAWSSEAQALYPNTGSNRDFVQTVYLNSFGRNPDEGGWDYWTDKLDALGTTDLSDRGAFVAEVLLGAYSPTSGEADRNYLTNRHDVALYYVNQMLLQPAEGYDASINDLLDRVNADASTASKAQNIIDHAFADPVTLTGVMGNQALFDALWAAG